MVWIGLMGRYRKYRMIAVLGRCDDYFAEYMAWPIARDCISSDIADLSYAKAATLSGDNLGIENTVLWAACQVCLRKCISGEHHIYRGRLSMTGASLRALAVRILDRLEVNGFLTCEDKREEISILNEGIADAG